MAKSTISFQLVTESTPSESHESFEVPRFAAFTSVHSFHHTACDLLKLYFTRSSTTHVHPTSPYILGYVFRKESFLKKKAKDM